MQSFANKVVVVTGAASGIGRALAQQLSMQGAHLALSDVNLDGLEETRTMLRGSGKVTTQQLNVADREAWEAYAEQVVADHGQVDMIINNAGVALSETVERMSYEDMEWIVNINFWGVVYGTKSFLPHLKERPEAAIINVSSIFGIIALPTQAAYNATKFAVRGFTESLRQELKNTNVFVSTVHPGGIKTNIVRNGRMKTSMTGDNQTLEQQAKHFEKIARTTPAQAADTILSGVKDGKRRILIGSDARLMDRIQRLFPVRYTDIFGWALKKLG
ncbi:SDR family oxidoreductase [uncultured Thalassolituus sp.]|uniref:SDR family NAD(P)-dependent oxidoreductase n=1 Tax=uncultured Thalassolituus sp. TaxID=285273 RepID=UPI00261FC8A8|nr:SDR family NAD(P)-dependent oxidoreductase [uncultured Thalassolituus sp.]